ncbi:DNA polymerase III subunit gamma and tau [Nocardia aurantiaca]|uniref:DNA polymerase III subunit gamma/tau n=1 Tax=Nocardia aurantiaca TaxID=2675850 RepID=A0A6I3KNI0_9NOCA|nr:DNA polymerase III subunit gamma and tau [Nocardia aurantiaca]MTE12163.1 DNA polymerase III subunit gamma and tau [Nocardia aurantiaca]
MALYRKYRPATFAEVVGQEHVTDPLSIALDTGRISHAYLFSGPRGCGKTSSARILARSLNCVQGPTSKPCGVCPSCVALGPGGSGNLDVIELDAASHGGVDDTRELRDRAFYAPAESRYRVFIVDEAHMVTTAGFNALLKIVEEPPAHLIFVFATTEPDKVLPTIRSRTHHYPFRLLPPATMRGLLGKICDQEGVRVEESVYPLVIRAGGGSPRDSLSVLDQLLAGAGPEGVTYPRAVALLGVTDVALIDDAVEALVAADGAALFGTIDRVVEAGHDPRRFATDLLERLRDLILLRAVPDATDRNLVTGPGDVIDRMRSQADRLGPAALARHAELLHEGLGDMRGATNPRLLLEVIAARMLLPAASDDETATLQRLETLERRMASGAIAPASQSAAAPQPGGSATAAPPATPTAASAPRRRGAEALAALRAEKAPADAAPQRTQTGTVSSPADQGHAPQPLTSQGGSSTPATDSAPSAAFAMNDIAAVANPSVAGGVAVRPPELGPVAAAAPARESAPAARVEQPAAVTTAAAPDAVPVPGSPAARPAGAAHPAERAAVQQASAPPAGAEPAEPLAEPGVRPAAAALGMPVEDGAAQRVSAQSASAAPVASAREAAADPTAQVATSGPDDRKSMESSAPATARSASSVPFDAPADQVVAQQLSAGDAVASSGFSAAEPAAPVAAHGAVASAPAQADSTHDPDIAGGRAAASDADAPQTEAAGGAETGLAGAVHAADDVLQEIEAAWADIRAKVREFGAAVQALLTGASVARVEGETIVFAHLHAPLAQRLSQPQNLDAVRSAVRAVLGRDHDVRWEVGGPAAGGGSGAKASAGRGPAGGQAAPKKTAPKFSRPSQAKAATAAPAAEPAAASGWGSATAPAPQAPAPADAGPAGGDPFEGGGARYAPPEDDIPLPDGPDLPDDPGPGDYSPVGYDGVPPATTPEEEREMLEESAKPVPPEERRDPDEVALALLRSELGATPLEG